MSHHATLPLTRRPADLAAENRALADENARLRTALAASMLKYHGHESHFDAARDLLTIVTGAGDIYELVRTSEHTASSTTYKRAVRKVATVPGSPASRVALALGEEGSAPMEGMDCFDDGERVAS